ncbi:hypothetical protein ACPPVO_22930 [Dactylosporangium sp. McL0621]|uniref:hypothetical protein n=1 Tax=Dactylosporangium sp. McL0621 TaxID=3415678 RepID=UPI003CEB0C44
MIDAKLIEVLFPGLAAVRVVAVVEDGGVVWVDAQAKAHSGNCPACGKAAGRVHDRYVRRLLISRSAAGRSWSGCWYAGSCA